MQGNGPYLLNRLSRRGFLLGAAGAGLGALLPLQSLAQRSSSIHDLRGEVRLNGNPIDRSATIRPGDEIATARDGFVAFSLGQDAFMLRERGLLRLEAAQAEGAVVQGLRLVTGALGAVFGRRSGGGVRINAPTVTAGIRGTGCYLEVRSEGTYFCACYGTIELDSVPRPADRVVVASTRHDAPRMFLNQPRDGSAIAMTGPFENHTDAEMDALERSVGRRVPWMR
jgi:hypothetical protein